MIPHLHAESRLQSFEQRRILQFLKLIHVYVHSKERCYLKICERAIRSSAKIVFDTMTKCSTKYQNSTFYQGQLTWNMLPETVQLIDRLELFTKYVKPVNIVIF